MCLHARVRACVCVQCGRWACALPSSAVVLRNSWSLPRLLISWEKLRLPPWASGPEAGGVDRQTPSLCGCVAIQMVFILKKKEHNLGGGGRLKRRRSHDWVCLSREAAAPLQGFQGWVTRGESWGTLHQRGWTSDRPGMVLLHGSTNPRLLRFLVCWGLTT